MKQRNLDVSASRGRREDSILELHGASGGRLTTPRYPTSSLFVSAKALTACSNSLRECAALTCVRTRAMPWGTTG